MRPTINGPSHEPMSRLQGTTPAGYDIEQRSRMPIPGRAISIGSR